MGRIVRERWRQEAACRNRPKDLFFSESQGQINLAKHICKTECSVRADCLEYALRHDEVGVWGATDYDERKKMLRLFGPNLPDALSAMTVENSSPDNEGLMFGST